MFQNETKYSNLLTQWAVCVSVSMSMRKRETIAGSTVTEKEKGTKYPNKKNNIISSTKGNDTLHAFQVHFHKVH